ncbi:MAG: lysine-2,3-aminomutase-like protein [Alphaproteobacteria bacterium]|nr:lysine-2,3-aminomutase-like protein [Alphaproteobacteria bacterium]
MTHDGPGADKRNEGASSPSPPYPAEVITNHLRGLMDPSDPQDPIGAQFITSTQETIALSGERADPIGDAPHSPIKGIVHRYADRVLLTPHFACPAYCRFCFRRDRVGQSNVALSERELDAAIDYIRRHDEIWEVILSGGDPLMLSPARLGPLITALNAISHVGVIRIHTRVPVTDPGRITPSLVATLRDHDSAVYVVLHCNHAREMSQATRDACRAIVDAGVPMLAQTVLLRNVNDNPATLSELMRTLVRNRIKPYYLHHCDMAVGTGHFRTTLAEGQGLMRTLRGAMSGLCQPLYVLDIPGGYGKVPVGPCYLHEDGLGTNFVEDPAGEQHLYPP